MLIKPLHDQLSTAYEDWTFDAFFGEQATKANLSQLMGGSRTPALLCSASHGMEFPFGDERQIPHNGAILCQDWPGPKEWQAPVPQDHYFAGDDLDADANLLLSLIHI